jgi:excisionase family DNA binding protein
MIPSNEVLTLAEAAVYLKTSEDTLLQMARDNKVPARKLGEDFRFSRKALDAWFLMSSPLADWPWPRSILAEAFIPDLELLVGKVAAQILAELDKRQPAATKKDSKQALLALAGKYKDDPFLESIVKDAMKDRGRVSTEDQE